MNEDCYFRSLQKRFFTYPLLNYLNLPQTLGNFQFFSTLLEILYLLTKFHGKKSPSEIFPFLCTTPPPFPPHKSPSPPHNPPPEISMLGNHQIFPDPFRNFSILLQPPRKLRTLRKRGIFYSLGKFPREV